MGEYPLRTCKWGHIHSQKRCPECNALACKRWRQKHVAHVRTYDQTPKRMASKARHAAEYHERPETRERKRDWKRAKRKQDQA